MDRPETDEVVALLAADPDMVTVAPDERFVVLYAVSYDEDRRSGSWPQVISTAKAAARAALDLTLDEGRGNTTWLVFDTVTGEWSKYAQSELEEPLPD